MSSFWVGDWLVRPNLSEIRRGDVTVHLEPRSIEVLEQLARAPGEVLAKEALIEGVWGGAFVTDEVLTHAIWELRKAFGDDARNPTYIQTIPRRGYRLVAATRPHEDGAERPSRVRWALSAATLLLAAVAAWLYFGIGRDNEAEAADPRPRLVLEIRASTPAVGEALGSRLRALFAGSQEFRLLRGDAPPPGTWERPVDARDHRLEVSFDPSIDQATVDYRFRQLASGLDVAGGSLPQAPEGGLDTLAGHLVERISLFGRINQHPLAHDPHLAPWFDLSRHDWRAVRSFLEGAFVTLRWESGSQQRYREAMTEDPAFLAPRVWGMGPMFAADEVTVLHYRETLERLARSASDFEAAVARWASSTLAGEFVVAQRHLSDALGFAPANGPVLINLAATELLLHGPEAALSVLQGLIDSEWRYPSLYPQAAEYAIFAGDLERARELLARGLSVEPVTVESLALLEALALLEGDDAAAGRFGSRLDDRLAEIDHVDRELRVERGYRALLARLEGAGRGESVRRLRERLERSSGKPDRRQTNP